MSDVPCHLRPPRYDHTPDHIPTLHGEEGYCKVCLEYNYTVYTASVGMGGVHLGLRWAPCVSALEIEARKRQVAGSKDATTSAQPAMVVIRFHAERQYSIDGNTPLKVSDEFDSILQAFLQSQGAMETRELEDRSGVTNVSRAMRALAAWNEGCFKAAIRIPSGKAKGGYFVHVQPL